MIVVGISGLAWQRHPAAAHSLLTRIIEAGSEYTLILDTDAVAREAATLGDDEVHWEAHIINFGSWLRSGLSEDGVLDVHAIRGSAKDLSVDKPVVLDARGRRPELIQAALFHLRYAWFPLEEWHPAFILLCDDVHVLPLSNALTKTFYCQPKIPTEREISRIVKRIQRNASTHRWLGPGIGRWQRKVLKFGSIIHDWFDSVADKREERLR